MLDVQKTHENAVESSAPASDSSPPPSSDPNSSPDLADEKLRAEIAKTLAEADKLKAEAHNAAWKSLWRQPGSWAAILTAIAAIVAALWQLGAGYLEAHKTEIAAQVKELDAQRTLLKGEIAQLDAQRLKLESEYGVKRDQLTLQNDKLQYEQTKLKDQQEQFKLQKDTLLKERDALAAQVQSLTHEAADLKETLRLAPLKIPLETIVNNRDFSQIALRSQYETILAVLREDSAEEHRDILERLISTNIRPSAKAYLRKTMYQAWQKKADIDALITILRNGSDADYSLFYVVQDDGNWPPNDVRKAIFLALSETLGKAKAPTSAYVAAAMTGVCRFTLCDITKDDWYKPALAARDALVAIDPVFKIDAIRLFEAWLGTLQLIQIFNPHAALLLLADSCVSGRFSSQIYCLQSLSDFKGSRWVDYDDPSVPRQTDMVLWRQWLKSRQTELEAVLTRPANEWPQRLRNQSQDSASGSK
jgi:hypothetical protein